MKASERIYQSIERRIADGDLLPGDPVDEARLMSEFGVSRTPVREAMLQLQSQGLLAALPRDGVVVAKMDVQQLFSMWELLAELEGLCARFACERMTEDEREALARAHARGEAVVARDDALAWQDVNRAFHEVIYAGARNPYLRQEILQMRTRTQAYRSHAFSAIGRLRTSHQNHARILEAIVRREPQAAADAAFGHMSPDKVAPGVAEMIVKLPRELLN